MTDTTTTTEFVRHTCNTARPGQSLPFGRKAPEGECPRCDELRAGVAPREAHPAIRAVVARQAEDTQRVAEMKEHFASERHRSGACGTCTFGQW